MKSIFTRTKLYAETLFRLLKSNTLQNVIFFSGGILIFIIGVVTYGVILNLREVSLSEAMRLQGFEHLVTPNIIIDKKNYTLNLYEDTVLIKSYRASFGRNTQSAKQKKGDNATPTGEYKICSIDTSAKYYKFFRVNYPNLDDASDALRKGIISQMAYDKIKFEFYYENCTSSDTPLGGDIGIHGLGELDYFFKNLPFVYNWTDGSIALSNESIDELYSVVRKGTNVIIK